MVICCWFLVWLIKVPLFPGYFRLKPRQKWWHHGHGAQVVDLWGTEARQHRSQVWSRPSPGIHQLQLLFYAGICSAETEPF